ncbi:phosphonate C-P lyase system protein PhnH [Prosthecomicrobium pneumaticum]|uniref:Alpha-D-ribose 1-methylphosphonate 5-triphosphate synthase subunit PhnH n=1 Tax=Prosthecomicrobium pneumaticum TaxID=81895 RepID=A0A7W9L1Q2_9HYPH|nr:phosphonate C-P lyase system protein PhnH [Prosthecomicrobium pneumaticum]MBB5752945.1 alpha-D-ribose 1-methylphosphonate 5-triphosphate synthase subunit PhnH [Prosthecomicrobium pneumaticum]
MSPLTRGFAEPAREAQAAFRVLMTAMSRPATVHPFAAAVTPPPPLSPELAAIALSLADPDAPIWLDPPLAAVPAIADYLRFHTGAKIVGRPDEAAFALVSNPLACPYLDRFAQGLDAYPDRSTTVVLALATLDAGSALRFRGPGIDGVAGLDAAPLPRAFAAELDSNHALFPRGVDLVLLAPGRLAALPRSARRIEGA